MVGNLQNKNPQDPFKLLEQLFKEIGENLIDLKKIQKLIEEFSRSVLHFYFTTIDEKGVHEGGKHMDAAFQKALEGRIKTEITPTPETLRKGNAIVEEINDLFERITNFTIEPKIEEEHPDLSSNEKTTLKFEIVKDLQHLQNGAYYLQKAMQMIVAHQVPAETPYENQLELYESFRSGYSLSKEQKEEMEKYSVAKIDLSPLYYLDNPKKPLALPAIDNLSEEEQLMLLDKIATWCEETIFTTISTPAIRSLSSENLTDTYVSSNNLIKDNNQTLAGPLQLIQKIAIDPTLPTKQRLATIFDMVGNKPEQPFFKQLYNKIISVFNIFKKSHQVQHAFDNHASFVTPNGPIKELPSNLKQDFITQVSKPQSPPVANNETLH